MPMGPGIGPTVPGLVGVALSHGRLIAGTRRRGLDELYRRVTNGRLQAGDTKWAAVAIDGLHGSALMLWMAVFADMGASLLVVFNGLRLLRR